MKKIEYVPMTSSEFIENYEKIACNLRLLELHVSLWEHKPAMHFTEDEVAQVATWLNLIQEQLVFNVEGLERFSHDMRLADKEYAAKNASSALYSNTVKTSTGVDKKTIPGNAINA